jgi:hypothetical protein
MKTKVTYIRNKNAKRRGRYYVNRIYVEGFEPLDWFQEFVQDEFESILENANDPGDAVIRGEAQWRWMKTRPCPTGDFDHYIEFAPFEEMTEPTGGAVPVTVIRVHRSRGGNKISDL